MRRRTCLSKTCLALIVSARIASAVEPPSVRPSASVQAPSEQGSARPVPPAALLPPVSSLPSSPPKPALHLPAFIAGMGSLGTGGAFGIGGAGSGRRDDPRLDCGARCFGYRDTSDALSLTTKVLSGVAAAGVGAGLVLLLAAPRKERAGFVPSLGISLSGSKATARVTWKF